MTEDKNSLLVLFEIRFKELLTLCDQQKLRIQELETALEQKNTELQEAMEQIREWNAKYDNMLTAQVLSIQEGEVRKAKMRLSRLVREVEKCIALLK